MATEPVDTAFNVEEDEDFVFPDEDYEDDHDFHRCPMDGGEPTYLGRLGKQIHLRCRDCGYDWSEEE